MSPLGGLIHPHLQEVNVRVVLDLPLKVPELLEYLGEPGGLLRQDGGVQEVDRVVGQPCRAELLVLVGVVSPNLKMYILRTWYTRDRL